MTPRRTNELDHLTVEVTGRDVQVSAEPGPGTAIRVGCGDETRELRPGDTVRFHAAGVLTGASDG